MAFPTPALTDTLWTEAGLDYKFDGTRWRPLTLGAGGGLTEQQQKIISALFTLANRDGELLPPSPEAFLTTAAVVSGRSGEWWIAGTDDPREYESLTFEIDGGEGEAYQRVVFAYDPDRVFMSVSHTFNSPPTNPVRARVQNDWGISDWVEWPAVFSNPVETWTVTAAPALDGGAQPTRESLSIESISDSVYYSALSEDTDDPNYKALVFDFGAPVAINRVHIAGVGSVTVTDGVVDLTRCEDLTAYYSLDGVEWEGRLLERLGPYGSANWNDYDRYDEWARNPVMNDTLFEIAVKIPAVRYIRIGPRNIRSYMTTRANVISFSHVNTP